MKLKKIGIDLENGDEVCGESVKDRMVPAIRRFSEEHGDTELFLHGKENEIKDAFGGNIPVRSVIVPATEFYSQHEKLTRPKKGTALNNLVRDVKDGVVDGFFSIGDTSKIGTEAIKMRTRGLKQSLVAILPSEEGEFVCSDVGFSVPKSKKELYSDVIDDWARGIYTQGIMASVYVNGRGVDKPKWGIMSNGVEDHKGSDVDHRLEEIIRKARNEKGLDKFADYIGKIEPNSCFDGDVDVVLSDGYKGNLFLKSIEGSWGLLTRWMKEEVYNFSNFDKVRLAPGMGVLSNAKKNVMSRANPDKYSGAIALGYDGIIVKGHGNCKTDAIYYGLCNLADCTTEDSGSELVKAVEKYMPSK